MEQTETCPFCGTANVKVHRRNTDYRSKQFHYIYCNRCRCRGPLADSPENAVRKWNSNWKQGELKPEE